MADGNGKTALWTPDGVQMLGTQQPERIELRPGVLEWLRQFADVAAALKLGIHCSLCKADLVGRNRDSDKTFSVTCGCRELIGTNRDWRPPTDLRVS